MVVFGRFFFFKQKTAYEMRISDWSSDVCSSDLCRAFRHGHRRPGAIIECRSGGGDGRVCGRSGSDRRAADHCLGRGVDHILAFRPGIDPFAIDVELVDCREGDGHAAAAFLLLRMMSAAFLATALAGALVLPGRWV